MMGDLLKIAAAGRVLLTDTVWSWHQNCGVEMAQKFSHAHIYTVRDFVVVITHPFHTGCEEIPSQSGTKSTDLNLLKMQLLKAV